MSTAAIIAIAIIAAITIVLVAGIVADAVTKIRR